MEIEFASIQQSNVAPHYPGVSEMISHVPDRQNTSAVRNIQKKYTTTTNISKSWRWFYACIKSRKMWVFSVVLFISLSITVAVLTVCLTLPNSSKPCEFDFQRMMKSSLISSSHPQFVALADLDNDQQMDIIVANSGNDTIGIFISNGNGTFVDQKTYSTDLGSRPSSVAVNDFNNDNYADIVVANYGTNSIGIFFGKDNGTLNDQKTFQFGSSRPLFVASGDFNKDNRTDLAVVNYGTNNIGILFGYGNGSFQNQITYSTGYDSFPCSLVVADFNNDNYSDIAVANHGTDNIDIFLNYGNGTFANQQTYTTLSKSNPSSIAVGDFNNDDKLDIVVANTGTGNIGIFFGHGNGSFQAQLKWPLGLKTHPQFVAVGDLDNNNALDIVVVDSQDNQVYVLPGNGNGTFPLIATYEGVSESRPSCVAVDNLNNNNKLDIVVVNYGTNNVLVLIDYSMKLSARQTNYAVESLHNSVSVAVGDFNNDHIFDIVYSTPGYICLRIGLGDGTFDSEIKYSIGTANSVQYICVGDLNNDTNMDIVAAFIYSGSIGVLLGNGNKTFLSVKTYSTGNGSSPNWIALGDVNNDHRLDMVSANTGSNSVGIHLGNGDGTFRTMVSYSTGIGTQPRSVAIGDLDHDTYSDLVVATGSGYLVILLGESDGYFTIWNTFSTLQNSELFSVALGDFNSDTYLDIVVADTFANSIDVFLGYGDATFGTQTSYPTSFNSNPYYVITADFNNDNISDIVATNHGTDEVIMFYGLGNGSFQLDRTYSTGFASRPYGIAAADFDNNTQLNLAVALSGNRHIAILDESEAAVFANQTKYSTGSAPEPYSVAIGDFNNDNRSDIVVANSGTDNLSILFGLDNNTFDMTMKYELGTDFYPRYVITCDVNNDGQSDMVSVNSKVDSISVILGYGNGTFAEQLIYSTGNDSYPIAVAAGDLNNDTRLDLVIANEGTDDIGRFFGFNYTLFQNQAVYSSNDSLSPTGIAVNDFNNDSYLDIVATFYGSDRIGIFFGNGNRSFDTIMTYSTSRGSGPWGITVNDFDNDSRSDIVVTNYDMNTVAVFLGYSNRSFTTVRTYSTGQSSGPQAITVGDVNNDKRLDIIVVNYNSDSIGILIGYGNGSFSDVKIYALFEGSNCWSISVGDFNNDGNLDIALANYGTHNVGILFGYGNESFRNQMILSMSAASRPVSLAVDDFNNDRRLDIAVADQNSQKIGIFMGYGNGTFATMATFSAGDGSLPNYLSVGDFNNDNISDIAVANEGTSSIVVLFGLGNGNFLLGTSYSTGSESDPRALAVGDFNNDTQLDIVVANNAANNIGVFFAYGNQPFGSPLTTSLDEGSNPHAIAVRDVNNDGCLDIVIVNHGTDDVSIAYGDCNGNLKPIIKYSTGNGSAPSSVAFADFNNDTYLDIVVTNSQTDNIIILFGTGNGTFVSGKNYTTGVRSRPYAVNTGDFNNDNITDIAIANYATNNIFLLYGYGNGTFVNQTSYFLGYDYDPDSIVVKDLNHDNRLDIVIACHGTDHVETLIKMCL